MNKFKSFKMTGWILLALILAGAFAVAFPAASASAAPQLQEGNPPPEENPGQTRLRQKEVLERVYQRELRLLEHVTANLTRTGRINERTETLIDRLQEHGIDTAAIEAALSEFIQQSESAAGPRDMAAEILEEHAGFNPQGKVTNVDEAIETVRTAGVQLRLAHRTFHEALRNLRETIRDVLEPLRAEKPSGETAPPIS